MTSSLRYCSPFLLLLVLSEGSFRVASAATATATYKDALHNSLLFLEGQRSGRLPKTNRIKWRGNSGLSDGNQTWKNQSYVNLTGGYYDAGDNVKYQFPMAFTITMLAWSTIQYKATLQKMGELNNALDAIKWGTDYFLKCNTGPTQLWVQVGDPTTDHACWERVEDMDTPRGAVMINKTSQGSEIAAETAAALAAASILYNSTATDRKYRTALLNSSMALFDFADKYRGSYAGACPFYCSYSGSNDELIWAAGWLYKATGLAKYLQYAVDNSSLSYWISEFQWENKNAGLQVLLSSLYYQGVTALQPYVAKAEAFMCFNMPNNTRTIVNYTPGGLLYIRTGANTQYVTASSLLIAVYGDSLAAKNRTLSCDSRSNYTSQDLWKQSRSQLDYILGKNPLKRSYMAGFGKSPPGFVHHRTASSPSIFVHPKHIGCGEGYVNWFHSPNPNPNIHVGAVVGGPNITDGFVDTRLDSSKLEPTTYINACFVGLVSKFLSINAVFNATYVGPPPINATKAASALGSAVGVNSKGMRI